MDHIDYLRFIAALTLVLGLILGLSWLLRRFGPHTMGGTSGGKRRLSIVETLTLDAKHRLVLIRKDDRDHLVLLGGPATVIETAGTSVETGENQ
jgi:flagellar protein FliO/FliZ